MFDRSVGRSVVPLDEGLVERWNRSCAGGVFLLRPSTSHFNSTHSMRTWSDTSTSKSMASMAAATFVNPMHGQKVRDELG